MRKGIESFTKMMKAVRVHQFGGPEVLQLEKIGIRSPGPQEILIKVEAIGVNPVETYMREGTYYQPKLPLTLGNDAVGIVDHIGANITKFKVGERVYTSSTLTGAYAQYTLASETSVHSLPPNLTFEQGAGINTPYSAAYHALFQRGRARQGESLLIHGASGGVGTAAVQLARSQNLFIIGTAGSEEGVKLVRNLGAHQVFNHRNSTYFESIMKIMNNQGVDLILEMLANLNLGRDLKILAEGGRVCVVGSRGPVEINPRDTMSRRADVLGVSLHTATQQEKTNIHHHLYQLFLSNSIKPVISRSYKLSEVRDAHRQLIDPSSGALGKLILLPFV